MRPLASPADLDALLAAPVALLFKHSDRCPISSVAHDQMSELARRHPGLPIWIVDVVDDRALSLRAAERLRVRHQSPQVILVVNGTPAWDVSHFQVRVDSLERRLLSLLGAPADTPATAPVDAPLDAAG